MKRVLEAVLLLALLTVGACSKEPETGPVPVRWDQSTCARCIMAVSDRNYSAQIRGGAADKKTKVYFFDDLGCAVLWLEQQPWRTDPRTEIWVNDCNDGQWLDARQVFYVTGRVTPMDYGLGAVPDSMSGALNYEQAVAEVHAREENLH